MSFCALLEYPLLASQLIFEEIDPAQLFELSRLSRRMELKIKNSGVRCKKHSVSFTGNPSVCLNFKNDKKLEIIFNRPFPKTAIIRIGHFKNFGFTYARVSENVIYVCPSDVSTFRGVYLFYDYIAGMFSTKLIEQLNVDVDKIKNLIGLLAIPEFSHCEVLQLIGEKMENEDAKYIQDHCEVKDTLVLNGNVGEREQHWKMYEIKNLVVKSNIWINSNDLILMKCENIYIKYSNITDLNLIEFVSLWKNGQTNQRLKYLEVHFSGESVLHGLKLRTVPQLPEGLRRDVVVDDSDDSDDDDVNPLEMELFRLGVEMALQKNDEKIENEEQKTVWKSLERRRMKFDKHGNCYSRGEQTFSSIIDDSDVINLDSYYRDIEKYDGTIASISIHKRIFKMIVWHEFELPPQ
uniref:FBA_2 domain-containing protein n=2 Tax=Caenorhabditis tropicalis TaxID=1561998 RepID=A0A1I7U3D4_9PELO